MKIIVMKAWVKEANNVAPIALLETRSVSLADATALVWRKQGFRVTRDWADASNQFWSVQA